MNTLVETDQAVRYIEQTEDGVLMATRGLSGAQWNFKQAPERWSIAEILEHLVFVQELVLGPVRARLAEAPLAPEGRDYSRVDDIILTRFPERSFKIEAPGPSHPTGRWTPEAALERLRANSAALRKWVETAPDLRARTIDSAPLKAITKDEFQQMDGYQWILAVSAHTERHTWQMREVQSEAGFPA